MVSSRFRVALGVLFLRATLLVTTGSSHEGHVPLPTKGVEVDVEKGLLTLSIEAQSSLGIQTAVVEYRAFEEKALSYATLTTPWQQQYFASSPLAGRIAKLHVRTGDRVVAGQLLAEVASPELEEVLMELNSARNDFQLSAKQLESLMPLVRSQAIPEREYLEIQSKHEQNRHALEIARLKLKGLALDPVAIERSESGQGRTSPELLPIQSSIAGTVSHTDLAVGTVVAANEHLFEIRDLSRLWVRLGVLERDVAKIKVGQPVQLELTAHPSEPLKTTISASSFLVDPTTHLATYWAEIDNEDTNNPRYLPGMYGSARIVTSEPTKLMTVPSTALFGTGAERYVLVEVAATKKAYEYRRQFVVVAAESSQFAQIREGGLYLGDRVVTAGGQVLSSFFILGSLRLSPEGIRNIGLEIEPVRRRVVEQVVEFDGIIDIPPEFRAIISSQFGGTLQRILVDRGQSVKAGQTIAEIRSLDFQQAQLELIRNQLESSLLATTMQRLQSADQGGTQIVTRRQFWDTEAQRNGAVNRRESARRTLLTLGMTDDELALIVQSGKTLETLPLRSPIGGVVVRLDKGLGESISEGQPLLEIQDLSHPWIQGFLSENEAAHVQIGMNVRIRLPGDPAFFAEGTLVRSARTFSDKNRTMVVWIEFRGPLSHRLEQNLVTRISATINQGESELAIPRSAVVREGSRAYVFVQKDSGLVDRRMVELGPFDDRYVQVLKGLNEGERIAIQGTAELQTTYASIR